MLYWGGAIAHCASISGHLLNLFIGLFLSYIFSGCVVRRIRTTYVRLACVVRRIRTTYVRPRCLISSSPPFRRYTSHFDISSFANSTLVFGPRGGVQGGRGWHFDLSQLKKTGTKNGGAGQPMICTGNVRGGDCGPVKIEGAHRRTSQPACYLTHSCYYTLFSSPASKLCV